MSSFLRALRIEIFKLATQPRTYLGFGGFLIFEVWLVLLLQIDSVRVNARRWIEHSGFTFADNFSGLTVGSFIMGQTINLLGAAFVALVAGEIVSKEFESGTMRMVFCRPISRLRLLAVKYLTVCLYTATLVIFVALTGLALGLLFEGRGRLLVLSPFEEVMGSHPFDIGLQRYFLSIPFRIFAVLTAASVGFFFSCTRIKPTAAVIATLAIFLADEFLRKLPFFQSIREHFLMSRVVAWLYVLDDPIPWPMILSKDLQLLVFDLACLTAGWLVFRRRDLG